MAAFEPVGWVEDPEFSLYARHLEDVRRGAPRWRSNPSNPRGRLAGPEEVAEVWDEAFNPLDTGDWTRGRRDLVAPGFADQGVGLSGPAARLRHCAVE